MQTRIEVTNDEEAKLIRAGLADPEVRAFVKVMGALMPLTPRGQARTLRFLQDHYAEHDLGVHE